MPVILEGLLTTLNADGSWHVAPMGPIVDAAWQKFVLRPFATSTTCHNLQRSRRGVFHITDDAALIATLAIGRAVPDLATRPTPSGEGVILADACRWYELQIDAVDESQARVEMAAHVTDQGRMRDFFGFNRARHAVIEAAILATRVHLLGAAAILAEFAQLQSAVDKTGSPAEMAAMTMLRHYVSAQGQVSPSR